MSNKYDLVIVGGGNGGMMAACRASMMGLKTLVIEKHNMVGGAAAMAMSMKKTKNNRGKKPQQPETRDLVLANRMSGSIHGGLSRIRLSLTFRIALHYCIQLLRSFLPICLILTVLFCFAVSIPVNRELNDLKRETWSEEETEKQVGYLTVRKTETKPQLFFRPPSPVLPSMTRIT